MSERKSVRGSPSSPSAIKISSRTRAKQLGMTEHKLESASLRSRYAFTCAIICALTVKPAACAAARLRTTYGVTKTLDSVKHGHHAKPPSLRCNFASCASDCAALASGLNDPSEPP